LKCEKEREREKGKEYIASNQMNRRENSIEKFNTIFSKASYFSDSWFLR